MTAADIIDALGGPAALAKALSLPTTTVGNWRGRNSIPARYHQSILSVAQGSVTATQIIAAHAEEIGHRAGHSAAPASGAEAA